MVTKWRFCRRCRVAKVFLIIIEKRLKQMTISNVYVRNNFGYDNSAESHMCNFFQAFI